MSQDTPGSAPVLEGIALGTFFALVGLLGVAYGIGSWFPELASRHGVGIDAMLNYLLVTTGGLFLIGHLVLGWFIWQGSRRAEVAHRQATPKTERRVSVALGMVMALIAEGGATGGK